MDRYRELRELMERFNTEQQSHREAQINLGIIRAFVKNMRSALHDVESANFNSDINDIRELL